MTAASKVGGGGKGTSSLGQEVDIIIVDIRGEMRTPHHEKATDLQVALMQAVIHYRSILLFNKRNLRQISTMAILRILQDILLQLGHRQTTKYITITCSSHLNNSAEIQHPHLIHIIYKVLVHPIFFMIHEITAPDLLGRRPLTHHWSKGHRYAWVFKAVI